MVGGAPVTQEYADAVGADGYASDASAAVSRAKASWPARAPQSGLGELGDVDAHRLTLSVKTRS